MLAVKWTRFRAVAAAEIYVKLYKETLHAKVACPLFGHNGPPPRPSCTWRAVTMSVSFGDPLFWLNSTERQRKEERQQIFDWWNRLNKNESAQEAAEELWKIVQYKLSNTPGFKLTSKIEGKIPTYDIILQAQHYVSIPFELINQSERIENEHATRR